MMLAHEVNMQRLRLKADGRIVELRDGQEFPLAPTMPGLAMPEPATASPDATPGETGTLPAVRDLRNHPELGAGQACAPRAGAGVARRDRPFAGNRFRSACHGTGARLVRGLTRFLPATASIPDQILRRTSLENAICWHGRFHSP
jgi:hypothetical protein